VRTQGLPPASLAAVRAVIEDARRLEGLPIEDEDELEVLYLLVKATN
jgi:hypothetical protein